MKLLYCGVFISGLCLINASFGNYCVDSPEDYAWRSVNNPDEFARYLSAVARGKGIEGEMERAMLRRALQSSEFKKHRAELLAHRNGHASITIINRRSAPIKLRYGRRKSVRDSDVSCRARVVQPGTEVKFSYLIAQGMSWKAAIDYPGEKWHYGPKRTISLEDLESGSVEIFSGIRAK